MWPPRAGTQEYRHSWLLFVHQDAGSLWKTLLPSPTIISCLPSHDNTKHSQLALYIVTCFSLILLHLLFLSVLLTRRSVGHSSAFSSGSSSSPFSSSLPSSLLTCPQNDFITYLLGTAHSSHNQKSSNSLPLYQALPWLCPSWRPSAHLYIWQTLPHPSKINSNIAYIKKSSLATVPPPLR